MKLRTSKHPVHLLDEEEKETDIIEQSVGGGDRDTNFETQPSDTPDQQDVPL